ncbi:MAG: aminotransferase class I/II-fold pyridoxal phosphate-dependent enzyme, partial [Lentisphaerae bacterium]|nr:aminotransferase class I/II-fold pyridoxal phosphate-dependent enzyme [Lentisphaerota bacterium]
MRSNFLPFSKPSISDDDISAVAEVLKSGWITTGHNAAAFENEFRDFVGCGGAVALASGTGGMHLILKSLGIGPGDEVITPSLTWVSTPNLVVLAGAKPVFADVDRDTLIVTADSVRACITKKTRLIIPVHFAGAAADIDQIRSDAEGTGAVIVEDTAHALGTYSNGIHVGKTGTSVFSFHPIKNITTGEGGMFCSDKQDLLDSIRRLKFHGLGVDAYDRDTQGRSPQAQVLEPGYKYNMTDMAAALGRKQLARVNQFNRQRQYLVQCYHEKLADIDEIIPLQTSKPTSQHAWHLFVVRLDIDKASMSRDDFMKELKSRNI